MAANPPSNRTGASKTNPVEGSANRTSPTTVTGETKNARRTPPAVPTTATKSVLTRLTTTSWRRETPSALNVAYASDSTVACRTSAWTTTTIPTSAERPARIHHPTAWGWMEDSISAASLSISVTERPPNAFACVWNCEKPAAPWRS